MAFDKLNNREQVLIFILAAAFVVGSYGLLRLVPQLKKLTELQAVVTQNQDKVKNPTYPDDPMEDIEDLDDKAEELEAELVNLRTALDGIEINLAPTESQEVILKISEAARASGVRVIESVPYLVQKKEGVVPNQANKPKISKRAQRKIDMEASNKVAAMGVGAAATSANGGIAKEGELIYRLVNDLKTPRPFQHISVEGTFIDLQQFIQSLRNMPWQTTIIKLDIDVSIQTPAQGLPQPITAKILVAM